MGVMMALIFVPFYAVSLVVSDPHSVIVQIFTYFPFSAPVTALLRNGFGSLEPAQGRHRDRDPLRRRGRGPPPRGAALPVRLNLVHLESSIRHRAACGLAAPCRR